MSESPQPLAVLGRLVLNIPGKKGLTASVLAPWVVIDGVHVEAGYGSSSFTLPTGPHRVEVHPRPTFTRGHARADINIVAGQETRIYYTPPISSFGSGSLSVTPGRSQTLVALIAAVIAFVVFALYFFWAASR